MKGFREFMHDKGLGDMGGSIQQGDKMGTEPSLQTLQRLITLIASKRHSYREFMNFLQSRLSYDNEISRLAKNLPQASDAKFTSDVHDMLQKKPVKRKYPTFKDPTDRSHDIQPSNPDSQPNAYSNA